MEEPPPVLGVRAGRASASVPPCLGVRARDVGRYRVKPEGEAMGRLRDGQAFLHRALVLSSLLLLASGEIFFEERFDDTTFSP